MTLSPSRDGIAVRALWGLLASLLPATLGAQSVSAGVIIIACPTGSEQRCPLQPESTGGSGALEYEPSGAMVPTFDADTLLTSGWIDIPSTPELFMSSVGAAEIRSITLPAGLLEAPASLTADAEILGDFLPGERVDFEVLLGSAVSAVGIVGIELLPGAEFPLLVEMRSFDVETPEFGFPTGNGGRVQVILAPEPTTSTLLAFGLMLVALQRRGLTSRCS